jgi:hypothetical protein
VITTPLTLDHVLALAGILDDAPGSDTGRERFRRLLKEHVKTVRQIRDDIDDWLQIPGVQHQRALQDVVTYLGRFLQFEVTYGAYEAGQGPFGFDGLWRSPRQGFTVVVETVPPDVYVTKTGALLGHMDALIFANRIPSWSNALGLYVVARVDPEAQQLENAIVAEMRNRQLHLISLDALLALAELVSQRDLSHEHALDVLRASGPSVDAIVHLMARVVAKQEEEPASTVEPGSIVEPGSTEEPESKPASRSRPRRRTQAE